MTNFSSSSEGDLRIITRMRETAEPVASARVLLHILPPLELSVLAEGKVITPQRPRERH